MKYCFKCRQAFNLDWNSFEAERNPVWYGMRKYCPAKKCTGYVYNIDDDMVPIIDAILDGIAEAEVNPKIPFTAVTLHSCAGHWDEEFGWEYPSTPYIAMAVMPKGINLADSEYFSKPENQTEYFNSFRDFVNRGKYPPGIIVEVSPTTECMWDGFADPQGREHCSDEGWIALDIRVDASWVAENLPDIGFPHYTDNIDALVRHGEYIKMFITGLVAVRDHLMTLWNEPLPEED